MDVTPVSAIGSGRGSQRAQIARENDYDREVRIAQRFRDAEADRRRRRRPPPQRQPAAEESEDELGNDSENATPRAGAELDTYL